MHVIIDANQYNDQHQTRSHHVVSTMRTQSTNINDIRPIPTLRMSISPNCVPLCPHQPTKLGKVPDSIQHDEASKKVIPVNIVRVRRWGRQCEHRIGPVVHIIPNSLYFIHLDPIFLRNYHNIVFIYCSLLRTCRTFGSQAFAMLRGCRRACANPRRITEVLPTIM